MDKFPYSYEVDPNLKSTREAFLQRSPEGVAVFASVISGYERRKIRCVPLYAADPNSCWIMEWKNPNSWNSPIYLAERVRTKIAYEIGLSMAIFQIFLPDYYDYQWKRFYSGELRVVCKYGKQKCVHPSHLVLRTHDGLDPKEFLASQTEMLSRLVAKYGDDRSPG